MADSVTTPGSWAHLAFIREADGVLRLYVNGVLEDKSSVAWTSALVVDALLSGTSGTTQAALDLLRIWDLARTEAEIAGALASTVDPDSHGLLRYYRFDDPVAVVDDTGNSADTPLAPGMSLPPSTSPLADDNLALVAMEDQAVTAVDTPTTIPVLDNGTDPDGSLVPASVTVLSGPGVSGATAEPNTASFASPSRRAAIPREISPSRAQRSFRGAGRMSPSPGRRTALSASM